MDVSRTFKKILKDSFLGDGSDNIFFQATNVKAKNQSIQFLSKENLGGKQEHGKGFVKKINFISFTKKKLLVAFIYIYKCFNEARKKRKLFVLSGSSQIFGKNIGINIVKSYK